MGEGQKGPIHNTADVTHKSRVYNCSSGTAGSGHCICVLGGVASMQHVPKSSVNISLAVPKLGILKLLGGVAVVSFVSVVDACRGRQLWSCYLMVLK